MDRKKPTSFLQKAISQIFTPPQVADFMVKNSLKYLSHIKDAPTFSALDPCAGKGVFLKSLLNHGITNIVAYEIDPDLKPYLIKHFPQIDLRFENVFNSDLKEKHDLIIGNPPYLGQNYNASLFRDHVNQYPFCKKYFTGNMDFHYFFIHLGIEKLKPGGILCFITTNYWINKSRSTGIKLLKPHVLEECLLLEYVDLSNLKIFKNAKGHHDCIFFLQKKTSKNKRLRSNKKIKVFQIKPRTDPNFTDEEYNEQIFHILNSKEESQNILKYESALSNKDLKKDGVWNLTCPLEVKQVIDQIEKKCYRNGKPFLLKNLFTIRNGLIFIKDEIFILEENRNLKIQEEEMFIKIKDEFVKINEREKEKLKPLYKSKCIRPFGYVHDKESQQFAIFLNKFEYIDQDPDKRNAYFQKTYPNLTRYLEQFKPELESILLNANENPKDLYFPRRGAHVKNMKTGDKGTLRDLEPFYESGKKIFIKYITDSNIFGYSSHSYYATSDTYFLWPKIRESKIKYPLILAYLNSKLVHFMFKAKNIVIKRSKTKLEDELPILNLNNIKLNHKKKILSTIELLASRLMDGSDSMSPPPSEYSQELVELLSNFRKKKTTDDSFVTDELHSYLMGKNKKDVKKILDILIFKLFDIEEKKIDYLLSKYYS
ncbi:MAG: Eco57I restriction-modification methylase domain-containing protein [Promethearchaeota archaeon]